MARTQQDRSVTALLAAGAVIALPFLESLAPTAAGMGVTITIVALATVRIYATGVLLYGQRPGVRRFIAAARRAG